MIISSKLFSSCIRFVPSNRQCQNKSQHASSYIVIKFISDASPGEIQEVKVFRHVSTAGLFSSIPDASNRNPTDPGNNHFSILGQLEKFRNLDGDFHFKLCYPEVTTGKDGGNCNEWIQSSNPTREKIITGFRPISLAFEKNGANQPWGGLGPSDQGQGVMDDDPLSGLWYMSIGTIQQYKGYRIPGPKDHRAVTQVELFVYKGKQYTHIFNNHVLILIIVSEPDGSQDWGCQRAIFPHTSDNDFYGVMAAPVETRVQLPQPTLVSRLQIVSNPDQPNFTQLGIEVIFTNH